MFFFCPPFFRFFTPGVASHAEEREKNIFVVAGDAIELPLADLSESKYRQMLQ